MDRRDLGVNRKGTEPGDIVMARPPGLGPPDLQEAIVRGVDPRFSPPWLTVSFRKKNGEWADRENSAYGRWEKKAGKCEACKKIIEQGEPRHDWNDGVTTCIPCGGPGDQRRPIKAI